MDTNISITTWILGLVVILVGWIFWKAHRINRYWNDRNVRGPKPLPLLGNIALFTRNKPNRCFGDLERLHEYGGKMYGYYFGTSPRLVVGDPALIRQLLIKDFHKCMNRQIFKTYHPAWNLSLFAAESDTWKRIRTISTPAFTSGRLRSMNGMMCRCVQSLCNYLDTVIQDGGSNGSTKSVINDPKQMFLGFSIDVIATTAFATETNANDDPRNPFVINGQALFDVKFLRAIFTLLAPVWLISLLGVRTFVDPEPFEFFVQYSKEVIRKRLGGGGSGKSPSTQPNDFVQLLIDARASEDAIVEKNVQQLAVNDHEMVNAQNELSVPSTARTKQLTEDEIIAQCILFFTAGFETTASTLFHCVYELARNAAVQEQLYRSLREAMDSLGEDISSFNMDNTDDAEASNKRLTLLERLISTDVSPYLEAVIKETLRKYPPIHLLFRRVTQDGFRLDGVPLSKDTLIEISIYAVHHNEKYFPQPERFDPDRFMPANKHLLVPYTYLPFGDGPRNCVGSRLAYQEMKLALAMLVLRGYVFTPHRDTPPVAPLFKPGGSPLLFTKTFPICVSKRDLM